ncbi:MAG: hypothetical protein ACTSRP_03535 [Candidatus Helarchaeota archaeon]
MSKKKFDILNYIDLRGPELKEIYTTILNCDKISENKLIDLYLYGEKIPGYFKNAIKLLKEIELIMEDNLGNLIATPNFPDLSFELNFMNRLSKLTGKLKIPYRFYEELIHQDIIFMEQKEFLPWCIKNFGDEYNTSPNSANFWITLMNNLGFIQKIKLKNSNYLYILPNLNHYYSLLSYYYRNYSKQNEMSIQDFGIFISKNFFEVFVNKDNLSQNFQDWLIFAKINGNIDLISFSDAASFIIKKYRFSHITIR